MEQELNYQEAVSIIELVTGMDPLKQSLNRRQQLDDEQEKTIQRILMKRQSGYPLQYILGKWSFMGEDYFVDEGVLIPRDDTEVAVRAAEELLKSSAAARIIDLCSGSGIIAVTLQRRFADAQVHAVELSDRAMYFLEKNVSQLAPEVKVHRGDVFELYREFEDGYFDLIISNPPYIPTAELDGLQREVRYEPRQALDGGSDGTDFYIEIIDLWAKKLRPGGVLVFELGEGQFEPVKNHLQSSGFHSIKGYKDLGGTVRAVTAVYRELEN